MIILLDLILTVICECLGLMILLGAELKSKVFAVMMFILAIRFLASVVIRIRKENNYE